MGDGKRSFFRIHLLTAIVMAFTAGFFVPEVAAYFRPDPFDVPGKTAGMSWDLAGTVGNFEQSVAANNSGLTVTRVLSEDPFKSTLIVTNSADKEIMRLDLPDHTSMPFIINHDVMYVADFFVDSDGCRILAFDMGSRTFRWQATLMAIGPVSHSKYHNEVSLKLNDDTLVVFGAESFGKYIECVDINTGKTIGHRAFLKSPPPGRSYSELILPLSKMLGAALAALVLCESLLRRRGRSGASVV